MAKINLQLTKKDIIDVLDIIEGAYCIDVECGGCDDSDNLSRQRKNTYRRIKKAFLKNGIEILQGTNL